MKEKLAHWLWRGRTRKGKVGVVLASILVPFIVIALAVPAPDEENTPASKESEEAADTEAVEPANRAPRVERVIDGDTIELDNGDRVHLVQIDAPEGGSECYGNKASAALRKLLPTGTRVRLIRDRRLDDVDSYNRLLRDVFKGDKNINLALIDKGAASVWFVNGDKGRYDEEFMRAADRARRAGRGVWGACQARLRPLTAFRPQKRKPAVAPPAPEPEPEPAPAPEPEQAACHPSYKGACLDPNAIDYDCTGGSGNGPNYVSGPIYVEGDDPFDLDRDHDGVACES